jgi:hypothetical protein
MWSGIAQTRYVKWQCSDPLCEVELLRPVSGISLVAGLHNFQETWEQPQNSRRDMSVMKQSPYRGAPVKKFSFPGDSTPGMCAPLSCI